MLGDLVCTTPQCTTGEGQIAEMDSVFQSAPSSVQAQFQASHDSIMNSFNSIHGVLTDWIPFNPDCCTIADLGNQAETLKCQILQAQGLNCSTLQPTGGMSLTTMLLLVGAGYIILNAWATKHV